MRSGDQCQRTVSQPSCRTSARIADSKLIAQIVRASSFVGEVMPGVASIFAPLIPVGKGLFYSGTGGLQPEMMNRSPLFCGRRASLSLHQSGEWNRVGVATIRLKETNCTQSTAAAPLVLLAGAAGARILHPDLGAGLRFWRVRTGSVSSRGTQPEGRSQDSFFEPRPTGRFWRDNVRPKAINPCPKGNQGKGVF